MIKRIIIALVAAVVLTAGVATAAHAANGLKKGAANGLKVSTSQTVSADKANGLKANGLRANGL